jgi:GNAT superfamily N-acetyltransferase
MSGTEVITTRAARVGDLPAVSAIRVATWRGAYAGIVPDGYLAAMDPVAEAERRAQRFADRPADEVQYLAERRGEPLGFAHGGRYRDPDAPATSAGEVYAIYVLPAEQGNGVGAGLLAAMTLALRRVHRFDPLLLWVLADNAPARAFYERHGWVADGVTHSYEVGGVTLPEVRYRLG